MKQLGGRVLNRRCSPVIRAFGMAAAAGIVAACASVGGGAGGTATSGGPGPTADQTTPDVIWPVKTREHVDLWLHGFALLQEDTTFVPFFKRGYSTNMIVLKNRANVVTQLDANRDRLRALYDGLGLQQRDLGQLRQRSPLGRASAANRLGFLGGAVELALSEEKALGQGECLFAAIPPFGTTFYSRHVSSPLLEFRSRRIRHVRRAVHSRGSPKDPPRQNSP